jgi:hypothetical protein
MQNPKSALIAAALLASFLVAFLAISPAQAQTPTPPSPDALAAGREVIQATHATDNFKAILPMIFQNLKAAVVQNRPEVEQQYDQMIPIFTQKAQERVAEMTDKYAAVYASNFTAAELHELVAFYRSPVGQKLVQLQPVIAQQAMAIGQQFGREVAIDVQQQMNEH